MKKPIALLIFCTFLLVPTALAVCEFGDGTFGYGQFGECDTLTRDVDYTINYANGKITFLDSNLSTASATATFTHIRGLEGTNESMVTFSSFLPLVALAVVGVYIIGFMFQFVRNRMQ